MTEIKSGGTYTYDPTTHKLKPERNTKGLSDRQRNIKLESDKKKVGPFKEHYG